MAALVGLVAGLAVFAVWMNIVGNPHVVETVLGLVIGTAVGLRCWWKTRWLQRWLSTRVRRPQV